MATLHGSYYMLYNVTSQVHALQIHTQHWSPCRRKSFSAFIPSWMSILRHPGAVVCHMAWLELTGRSRQEPRLATGDLGDRDVARLGQERGDLGMFFHCTGWRRPLVVAGRTRPTLCHICPGVGLEPTISDHGSSVLATAPTTGTYPLVSSEFSRPVS